MRREDEKEGKIEKFWWKMRFKRESQERKNREEKYKREFCMKKCKGRRERERELPFGEAPKKNRREGLKYSDSFQSSWVNIHRFGLVRNSNRPIPPDV